MAKSVKAPRAAKAARAATGKVDAESATPAHDDHDGHGSDGFLKLAIGSIGVVFGDIGTSPLYALRESLAHAADNVSPEASVLGVISLPNRQTIRLQTKIPTMERQLTNSDDELSAAQLGPRRLFIVLPVLAPLAAFVRLVATVLIAHGRANTLSPDRDPVQSMLPSSGPFARFRLFCARVVC